MVQIEISIDEFIGRKVKEAREHKHIDQQDLAKRVGLSPMGLSWLERGKRSWKLSRLARVAKELRVDIFDFLPGV